MVTGVGATMPAGGVTVGATPPTSHVPQEGGQPPAQTTTANPATPTTTTRRSGENRRVSIFEIFAKIIENKKKIAVKKFTAMLEFAKKI